jgi:TIR domain
MPKIDVFLSWSGRKGEILARNEWLPSIVGNDVSSFFSPSIEPGAMWSNEIAAAVRKSRFAILCVTRDSLSSPWLQFEAGAVWRGAETGDVCPLLFEVSADDLPAPLKLFQAKEFNESGFREVCKLLGRRTGVEGDRLRLNFKVTWPTLDREVQNDLRDLKANRLNKRLQRTARRRAAAEPER